MATLKDIAKKAGVSVSTVSRVMSGKAVPISEDTKKKIKKAARDVGYRKTPQRREDVRIALVQWANVDQDINDTYYHNAAVGITQMCRQMQASLMRFMEDDRDLDEKIREADGVILLGKFSKKKIDHFTDLCKNVVISDMSISSVPEGGEHVRAGFVSMDFRQGVRNVVERFISDGHRKIAYLGGAEYVGDGEIYMDERKSSFIGVMTENGVLDESLIVEDKFTQDSGYKMMKDMLAQNPTAVFAASDEIAVGAMKAAAEAGLAIPGEISFIGCNNSVTARFAQPELSSLDAPASEMGKHSVNLLLGMIRNGLTVPVSLKIPCRLSIRQSSGRL